MEVDILFPRPNGRHAKTVQLLHMLPHQRVFAEVQSTMLKKAVYN